MNLNEWAKKASQEYEKDQQQIRDAKGMRNFLILKKGENKARINTEIEPRAVDTKYGRRLAFAAVINGLEGDLLLKPSSRFYGEILKKFTQEIYEFTILRTGEGKTTRFELI